MTVHTCVATVHTSPEITTRREGHVHFRERKLPLRSRRAAPSVRGLRALWRVFGRAARSGGRAGRACWSPVTGRWQESGHSRCCGPLDGLLALLPVISGCCGLMAPTLTRDFAHAATAHEVRLGRAGRMDRRSRVRHAVCFVLLCVVA